MLKHLHVVAAIICHNDVVLAARRLPGGAASEKWEFPGGKVEAAESPRDALIREIREELDLEIAIDSELGTFVTDTDRHTIELQCFICQVGEVEPTLRSHSEIKWLRLGEIYTVDWATPDLPAVAKLLQVQNAHQPKP